MTNSQSPTISTAADTMVDQRLFVQAVERNMIILQLFQGGRRSLLLSEISNISGIGRSAVQRIVYTLVQLGYLQWDVSEQRYSLSPKMILLCDGLVNAGNSGPLIQSALQALAEATGESVAWVGREGDEIIILQSARSHHYSHVSLPVGQRFCIVTAASGQVFLAYDTREDARATFMRVTNRVQSRLGPTTFEDFYGLLDRIRARGYALTEKSEDLYSVSMSLPVLGMAGLPVGTVNVSALQSRISKARAESQLLSPMRSAVKAIENALGGTTSA